MHAISICRWSPIYTVKNSNRTNPTSIKSRCNDAEWYRGIGFTVSALSVLPQGSEVRWFDVFTIMQINHKTVKSINMYNFFLFCNSFLMQKCFLVKFIFRKTRIIWISQKNKYKKWLNKPVVVLVLAISYEWAFSLCWFCYAAQMSL